MLAEHLANRPVGRPRQPTAGWLANVEALAVFRDTHGPPRGDSNQRVELDAERWTTRLEQLGAFREAEGRWPRFRGPRDQSERVLGVWLHGQRQAFGSSRLTRTEVRHLDLNVPGWNAWRLKHDAGLAARAQHVSGGRA